MNSDHALNLVDLLVSLFDPVIQSIGDEAHAFALMKDLGYLPPSEVKFIKDFSDPLTSLAVIIQNKELEIDSDSNQDQLNTFLEILDGTAGVIDAINNIGPSITDNFSNDFISQTGIVDKFPGQLADYLIIQMLERRFPVLHAVLSTLGIIDQTYIEEAPTIFNTPYLQRKFHWNRVGSAISNTIDHLKTTYAWNTGDIEFFKLIKNLHRLGNTLNLDTEITNPHPDTLSALNQGEDLVTESNAHELDILKFPLLPFDPNIIGLQLYPVLEPTTKEKVEGIGLGLFFNSVEGLEFEIAPRINLKINYPAPQLDSGIVFRSGKDPELVSNIFGTAVLDSNLFQFVPEFTYLNRDNEKILVFDTPIGARLEFVSWSAKFGVKDNRDFFIEISIKEASLLIKTDGSDGFLNKILPPLNATIDFDLTIGLCGTGLYFSGSSSLEILLPAHVDIGPVSIEGITIRIKPSADEIPITLGANIKASLGPLAATISNMGVLANLSFPSNNNGNLGPVQLDIGFKPPSGVGLSLDAGGFKGGGFLMFDSEKGEYAGALELDFNGLFSIKAIGIINTKMPDGRKGFSLLIVIAAEFTPIQLSFGFTLNGVGGIFGLNRMINVAALADGIRTNAVKSILFPEDVIANITRIISDIKQFFPQQPDHFVIGPMAKLGWGTPPIITVELGLLLDLPNPMFAIVGVLKALLPREDAPLLRLQVNFIGVVDFDRGYIFFRADLFDSRLLVYSITGSMAFLVSWGEAKALALSVGGFHPDFRDIPSIPALPDGFRSMARIGISLLSDDNPRLKIESYFAVTSNTVQFGARIELYAEAGGFNIYGFLGYDVLFQFDPFRFVAKLSGGVALRRHSSVIAGVNISATLSGPTPWDARGKATLSFLFFSISVGFHATWGDPPPAIAPATEDLLKLLQREFADTRNWRADLPSNNHLHVSLRKIELPAATEMLVIHPAGVLTFSQRSLPLEDFVIQKFGTRKPLAENKFKITHANSDNAEIPADYQSVREQFAPGNFLELSDSEKLSRKSFDNLPSGFKLTATSNLLTTLPVVRPVDYELSYLRRARIVRKGLIEIFVLAYERLVKGSAVRQSGLAQQQTRISLNAPPQVGLPQETFAVANAADLKSHVTNASGPVFFATQAEAYQQQQELIAQNPALAGQIQVVSHFELNPK